MRSKAHPARSRRSDVQIQQGRSGPRRTHSSQIPVALYVAIPYRTLTTSNLGFWHGLSAASIA